MKSLSKMQKAELLAHVEKLSKAATCVEDKTTDLQVAIEEYNGVLEEIRGWRDTIVSDMETYYDERSDNWRDGDAGSAYDEWKSAWENLDLDDVDEPDVPSMDHKDELDQLDTEPQG